MDISDVSHSHSSPGCGDGNFITNTALEVSEKLDNDKHFNNSTKTMAITLNPTNSHPLMYSPTSPITPDYPDLIPKQANVEKLEFRPGGHSTVNNLEESTGSLEPELLGIDEYKDELPGNYSALLTCTLF